MNPHEQSDEILETYLRSVAPIASTQRRHDLIAGFVSKFYMRKEHIKEVLEGMLRPDVMNSKYELLSNDWNQALSDLASRLGV